MATQPGGSLQFRVLGPLEVRRDGQSLALGGERQRALLALLLIHANELVATEQLVDLLFGDQPSTGAVKALQVAISRLRRGLGGADPGAVVQTRPGGYLLHVGRDQLDAAVFERGLGEGRALVLAGDPASGAARLRGALGLWRGAPLADLALVDYLQVGIRRWVDLRLVAVIERIDADLALGAGSELIAELEGLVGAEPLHERLRGQLMLALYRAGRQADALALYRETSELLRDELGLEPSRALQELERSILQQHAALEPAPRATPTPADNLPMPAAPFLGRAHELAELTPATAMRKTVTVLFAEIVDAASPGCELDPEVRGRLLSRRLGDMRTVLERHGGSVETHAGDVLIAVFGIPAVHEDDPLRAVRAAFELRRCLLTVGDDLGRDDGLVLAARVGIETGEVIAERGGSAVTGEPVKVARRLCELAAPSELLIGSGSHELVSGAVTAQALRGHTSAGGQAIAAFRLDDVVTDASARVRRFDSPMIGRERQLTALRTVFTNVACDRSCHLVTLLGAAGVGKSRLVETLAGELRESATVLYGRCLAYGEGITFWPLAEALRGLVGNAEPSAAAIAALAVDDPKAELIGEGVAVALGARDGPGATNEEVFWAARKLLEAVAQQRPLVVVFDDLHWAEPAFLDFVEHVSELVRDAPILLLCMARPELLDTRSAWGGGKLNATTVLLEPLDAEQSRRLIADVLGGPPLPAAVVTLVAQAAEGNPLFAEEFLAVLIDREVLCLRDGQWVAPLDLSRLPVPPTISALLASRLERLPLGERSLLGRAAVEGAHFHRAAVCELSPDSLPAAIDVGLTSLVRKDLIRSDRPDFTGDDAYRFRHALIRDAAYQSLPKQARAELHERFGSWLERTAAERLREVEATVGYHLAQASDLLKELSAGDAHAHELGARALRRLESAGRRALARGDRAAAIALLERGKSLLSADDTRMVGLLTDLGTALFEAGRLSAAEGVLQRASRLALAAGDECAEAKLLLQRQFLGLERASDGATEDAAATVARVIPVLARHDDEYGLCRAFRLRALVHWFAARTAAAANAWEQAAEHAMRAGVEHERAEILVWIASSLVYGPTPVAAGIRRCEEIAAQVKENLVAQAATLPKLAALHAMEGRFDVARRLLASSGSAFEELGLGLNSAVSHHAALVELLAGNAAEAERGLRLGYLALEQMGDKSLLATTAAYLARAILAQGRDEEAARYAARSDELAGAGDVSTQAMWRGVKARVLARTARIEDAERLARAAIALLEASDFVNQQGEALLDLAAVLEHDGRRDAAGAALCASLRHFEQKGNTVAAGRVRRRLAQIAVI